MFKSRGNFVDPNEPGKGSDNYEHDDCVQHLFIELSEIARVLMRFNHVAKTGSSCPKDEPEPTSLPTS